MRILLILSLVSLPAWAGDVPKGWISAGESPGDYEMTVDPQVKRVGRAAGVIRSRGTPGGFGTLMQMCKPREMGGKRWRMSAWAKSENVEGWGGLWMRVDGDGKQPLAFDNMQSRPLKGTTGWTRYAIVLDVPKEAVNLAFGVLLDGKGAVWIDDVDFEEVGTHIAVTDMMKDQGMPSSPKNLGFEDGAAGKLPSGWLAAGSDPGDFDMLADSGQAHNGNASGLIRSKVKSKGFGTLMQMISAAPYRGKRVRMRVWGKAQNVNGWAGFWLRVDGKSGSASAFDNMQNRAIKGTVGWTRYDVVLDVDAEASVLAFGELLNGEGAAWADDYVFEVVGKDVPVTDLNKTERDKEYPQNLSFDE
jgi:hypothetical protein